MDTLKALERAIAAGGGVNALARKLKLHQTAVSLWKIRKRLPAERVLEVERATGVSRHELRPDIYPDD